MCVIGLEDERRRKMEDLEDFFDWCNDICRVDTEVENWTKR